MRHCVEFCCPACLGVAGNCMSNPLTDHQYVHVHHTQIIIRLRQFLSSFLAHLRWDLQFIIFSSFG